MSRNKLFVLAMIIGLLFGESIEILSFLNLPFLIFIMILSMVEIDLSLFLNIKKVLNQAFWGILLNHIIWGLIFIGLGYVITKDVNMRAGIIFCVASPPGVAVVPFTYVLKGNLFFSVSSIFWGFCASLFFAPLLTSIFISGNLLSSSAVITIIAQLVLIPLFIGQVLRYFNFINIAKKLHSIVVNIGFAFILAVLIGVNRSVFFNQLNLVIYAAVISIISVFALAYVYKYFLKKININEDTKISIILIGTIKNSIFAATAGYSLINNIAAIPGLVLSIIIIFYLMVIEKIVQ